MKIEKLAISEIDRLIREGNHAVAEKLLNAILQTEIPREYLFEVAALARRLSRSEIGVGLLNPIVRPPATKQIEATIEERAEYAGCLIRLGIFKEAHSILDTVSPTSHPRSLLFRAFAHIARWDFEKSGACLDAFMKKPGLDPYEVLIAKVNMAVGHVFLEDFKKASVLLDELCVTTLETKNLLLYSNALELAAQTAILSGDYSLAEKLLAQANQALASSDTIDAFFLKKDNAILQLFKSKKNKAGIQSVVSVKEEAKARKFWEQGRDCDYYLAEATKKPEIAMHLYFGTPYESYRRKLLSKLGMSIEDLPDAFAWKLESGKKLQKINVQTGENSATDFFLNDGQVPQRLLKALASDFYRPRRMMEMFESVFPGEYFTPKYSVDKIHQGLRRLRSDLTRAKVPLLVIEKSGFYQLASQDGHSVHVICPWNDVPVPAKAFLVRRRDTKVQDLLKDAKRKFAHSEFTATDFARLHKTSERSAVRHLKYAVEKGWARKKGNARFVRYKINRS
jgi:hypothetical protein